MSEMTLQLQMLTRPQLEKLICMLSQEVASLEYKLQSSSFCNVNTVCQHEHPDCSAIIHGEEKSRHSRTNCTVLQRFVQIVQSTSHLKTKKSEQIMKQHIKVEQLSNTEDSIANLKNQIDDDNEDSCEHTDMQLLSDQKNVESSAIIPQNPIKTQINEHMFILNGAEFNRKREINNNTEVLPKEKLPDPACEDRKELSNHVTRPVSVQYHHQVAAADEIMDRASSYHVNSEQGSLQDRPGVIHHRCVNRSIQAENIQPLGKQNKYKVTKCTLDNNIHKIPCEVSSDKNVLENPLETSEENGMFICFFCRVPFQSKLVLTEHMETDHNCTQYSCIVCGKSFRYKHTLKTHQRGCQTGTSVLCSYCGKLVLQARLDMHMEKVHERPNYTCHICQKGFLKRECLEGHVNKHSNMKPYICEHCGRKYVYSTSLSSHRKQCVRASMPSHLQHPRSLDKSTSCVCEVCGLKFEGVSGLKDHLSAKHSNKVQHCSFCGKGFHWRPSYNRHIKKCVDRTDLEREKKRCKWLKSPKPASKHYVCVCGKQYPYRQSFRRHERSCHHKQEMESSVTDSVNTLSNREAPLTENLSSRLQLPV